ncbi:hypothetical protein FRX31_032595 [Thalictrum thalictroides]|uniref:Uncharacterized protein n=1 Tax=Thalictrum thalictroides TaxID=46969 RepID=A0A7J6UZG1_THATH|nr:hypothetical protein FRX31_032595 [Thalictrum thalictroides]
MEYIPESKRGSHMKELSVVVYDKGECAYPVDKKGKDYMLSSLQYEQARKWILKNSIEKSGKNAKKRLNHDVDVYEDPLNFEARRKEDALSSALVNDIVEDDEE